MCMGVKLGLSTTTETSKFTSVNLVNYSLLCFMCHCWSYKLTQLCLQSAANFQYKLMNSLAVIVIILVTCRIFSSCQCNCSVQDSIGDQTLFGMKIFVVMSSYHTIWWEMCNIYSETQCCRDDHTGTQTSYMPWKLYQHLVSLILHRLNRNISMTVETKFLYSKKLMK